MEMQKEKILITIRKDYIDAIDKIVQKGGASSRSELIDKIISGFLSDLKHRKGPIDTALGGLATFLNKLISGEYLKALLEELFGESKEPVGEA